MLRTSLVAAAVLCALASNADAKNRRHHLVEVTNIVGCSDPIMRPCGSSSAKSSRKVRHHPNALTGRSVHWNMGDFVTTSWQAVNRPVRYIGGRLVCAVNVNAELARRGIRGTGSAMAKSFLRWGRASRPVPGAVAVYDRRHGGHVAIVSPRRQWPRLRLEPFIP